MEGFAAHKALFEIQAKPGKEGSKDRTSQVDQAVAKSLKIFRSV